MSATKRRAAMWLALFLAILSSGCASTFRGAGKEAAGGAFDGFRSAAEEWWKEKSPAVLAEAKETAITVADKAIDKGGALIEAKIAAKVAEVQAKQERGEPLSNSDLFWLFLGASGLASGGVSAGKGILRRVLGLKVPVDRQDPPKT